MFSHSSLTDAGSGKDPVINLLVQQPKPRISRFWMLFLIGILLLTGSNPFWRLERPAVDRASVHRDQTVMKAPERQIPQTVTLIYANEQGILVRVPVDAERYSEFTRTQMRNLETHRQQLHEQIRTQFSEGMDTIFQKVGNRVPVLADYFFAYGTSYQLLLEAVTSAISNLGAENLKLAVSADLERLIQKQFEYATLKPELTDSQIHRLIETTLEQAHQSYLKFLATLGEDFQVFVGQESTYLENSQSPVFDLHLDWVSQIQKMRVADNGNASLGAIRGITLTTWGAISGKALGSSIGKGVAARLALPFVERAVLVTGASVTGAGSGSLGGPVGAAVGVVVGAAVGVVADVAIQKGVELLTRPQFEQDIHEVISAINQEFQNKLLPGLQQYVDVFFDDIKILLLQFKQ